jgi:flagellar basal body-associated protein FliL
MDVTLILVTLLSLALAAVMTVLAWRLAREQRRRSDARVAALAAEIHSGRERDLPLHHVAPVVTSHDLFDAAGGETAPRSRRMAVIAVAVAIVGCAALLWSVSSHSNAPARSGRPASAAAQPTLPASGAALLELTALTHDRDADRLTVRGRVRNPARGASVQGITAVVFLFDHDGVLITSARAAIDSLAPGTESPFVVTIPHVTGVGRYRVSFRTDDRIVPHIDRRDRPMAQAK